MSNNDGADPRLDRSPEELVLQRADEEPVVGRSAGGPGVIPIVAVFAVMAVGLFLLLNGRRADDATNSIVALSPDAVMSAPEPPLALPTSQPALGATNTPQSLISAVNTMPTPVLTPIQTSPALTFASAPPVPAVDPTQRRRAPTVVVDLDSAGSRATVVPTSAAAPLTAGAATRVNDDGSQGIGSQTPAGAAAALLAGQTGGAGRGPQLNGDEAFAARVGETSGPDRAVATALRDLGAMVPQGAMIPGVLETAINSDLPGYTRAVVSRDVRSFDGKHVLIPRGSRLIGQYKSAVALGQSRAFVIWTRVTRPDGVSVQIGSPGTDALGRGGLEGEVDRHFFARFSGSILLSVLNAGANALSGTPTTQIAIGSPGAAASAASSALQGDTIPPTIKVSQGEAIRIFVARDLDFSNVGPAR